MTMYRRSATILILGLFFALFACRTAPLLTPQSKVPQPLSLEEVAASIQLAALDRGWVTERVAPGRIRASIWVRDKHRAVVEIAYSPTAYSIEYQSSENLLANGREIHRNYNRWVSALDAEIQQELRKRLAGLSNVR